MRAVVDLRPMAESDIDAAEELWRQAWAVVDREYDLQSPVPSEADRQRMRDRLTHLCTSDPEGSWGAVSAGAEPGGEKGVGIAQAFVRDELWVLSLLGVAVDHQDRHIGRDLLEQTLGYGDQSMTGLILSSPDHRAQRRYLRAGFALHPCAVGYGVLDRERLVEVADGTDLKAVRPGDAEDRLRRRSVARAARRPAATRQSVPAAAALQPLCRRRRVCLLRRAQPRYGG